MVLDLGYSVLALAYLALTYWLASRPELAAGGHGPLARLGARLYHVPLYGGLGFFILQAVSRGQGLAAHRGARAAFTFAAAGAFAALGEWHPLAVPGRAGSLGDLPLDLAGVAGLLLVCALGTARDGAGAATEARRGP